MLSWGFILSISSKKENQKNIIKLTLQTSHTTTLNEPLMLLLQTHLTKFYQDLQELIIFQDFIGCTN